VKGLLLAVMHCSGSFGEWPLTTHCGPCCAKLKKYAEAKIPDDIWNNPDS
jgi:hypothetical protein